MWSQCQKQNINPTLLLPVCLPHHSYPSLGLIITVHPRKFPSSSS